MSRTTVAAAAEKLNNHFDLPETYDPAVRLELLVENGHNARRKFDPVLLEELAASIREKGVIEPLIVRPMTVKGEDRFEVVAGARRNRAAKLAGRTAVPCVIREYSDADVLELTLVENIQREALGPLEEANGFKTLLEFDKTRYSAAYIAQKIGRTEKYVWETLRLLNLIPELVEHLDAGRITRSHANALSRLTAKQQTTIAHPETGGLFTPTSRGLEGLGDKSKPGKFDGLKAVAVKELEAYIADHVRFDPKQAATTAPLEFGETAQRIEAAQAKPGRGAKVVAITLGQYVQESARAEERTFCESSWKRADGQNGSKRCDRAVLGVIAVGQGQGQAFDVCVSKDCDVHWKQERRDKERTQQLRSTGRSKQAEKREAKIQEERACEQAKRDAERAIWKASGPTIIEALAAKLKTTKPGPLTELLLEVRNRYSNPAIAARIKRARALLPAPRTAEAALRLLALLELVDAVGSYEPDPAFLKRASRLGVDVKKILRDRVLGSPKVEAK